MVPTQALHDDLQAEGFRELRRWHAAWTCAASTPRTAARRCARNGASRADDLVVTCVGRLAPEKNLVTLVDRLRRDPPRPAARPPRAGGRRPDAQGTADALPRRDLRRPACRRRPGRALRVGRPVPVSQRHRDLRQRHQRGDGERPGRGGVRLRRRATPDPPRRERRAGAVRRQRRLRRHGGAHRRRPGPLPPARRARPHQRDGARLGQHRRTGGGRDGQRDARGGRRPDYAFASARHSSV